MMRYYLDMSYDHIADKVLLIVPTTSLVKQMVGDFAKYSEHDALFDAEGMCHEIMVGKDKGHKTKRSMCLHGNLYTKCRKDISNNSVWLSVMRHMDLKQSH